MFKSESLHWQCNDEMAGHDRQTQRQTQPIVKDVVDKSNLTLLKS